MTTTEPVRIAHEPFLGRDARTGPWAELARGTFRLARECADTGRGNEAAELLRVAVLEAEELHDIYGRWPQQVLEWLRDQGVTDAELTAQLTRLRTLIGDDAMDAFEEGWDRYLTLTNRAAAACRAGTPDGPNRIEVTRQHWQRVHDGAVDRLYGVLDVAVRLRGERCLLEVWNLLMAPWYDVHAERLDLDRQEWSESARQLRVAILDGFHAHLTGPGRQGDVELLEEEDRWGFRFAPCGSGGRTLSGSESPGGPRPDPPFNFSVTTERHDWAWNKTGVCSYCVHCCLLNELVPIDRLGYPTRIVDPPVWPDDRADPRCTWWVYKDPSLVPDEVYTRVGRSPERRPLPADGRGDRD